MHERCLCGQRGTSHLGQEPRSCRVALTWKNSTTRQTRTSPNTDSFPLQERLRATSEALVLMIEGPGANASVSLAFSNLDVHFAPQTVIAHYGPHLSLGLLVASRMRYTRSEALAIKILPTARPHRPSRAQRHVEEALIPTHSSGRSARDGPSRPETRTEPEP